MHYLIVLFSRHRHYVVSSASLAKKSFKRPQSSVQSPRQRPTIRTLLKKSHSYCMRIVNNKEIDKIFMCTVYIANLNCQLIVNNILGFLSVVFFC